MNRKIMINKKIIAWGASPLLEIYLRQNPNHPFQYCIDIATEKHGQTVEQLKIYPPERLNQEHIEDIFVIITAMSSTGTQAIHSALSQKGFVLNKNYTDLSYFLKDDFKKKAESLFNKDFSEKNYNFARAFNFNSNLPLETSILGNWLLSEAISSTKHLEGAIAEIGAYRCGNVILQLTRMALEEDVRKYYVFDSFEGFPKLTENDPLHLQNIYNYDYRPNFLFNLLGLFDQSEVYPGFIPYTFKKLADNQKFSIVFYDCDLYQPALDTYDYVWDRLEPGGILIIHDNITTKDGWAGVRKATDDFFRPRGVRYHDFWETTMSVIFKEK